MVKVKVKEVYDKDPDNGVGGPILVRFQHAAGSRQSSSLDLSQIFKTAVFHSDPTLSPHKELSHLNRSQGLIA